jgi:hypothetical protein
VTLRRLLLVGVFGCLATVPLAAQGRGTIEQRLDPQTFAAVRAIIDSARRDSVPSQALEDKALEGVAKNVPPARIVVAVHQLAGELRDARALLRAAAPGAALADGEIIAAADARRRGVPPVELSSLRGHVSSKASLVVAFTVLGDLVQRGVPAGQARDVVEQLIAAGVSAQQLADVPARMDVGLRVGAPPLDALRSALPVPLRPVRPPPGGTPPKPNPSGHGYF